MAQRSGGISSATDTEVASDLSSAFEYEFINVTDTELFTDSAVTSGISSLAYEISDTETETDSITAFATQVTTATETETFTDFVNALALRLHQLAILNQSPIL